MLTLRILLSLIVFAIIGCSSQSIPVNVSQANNEQVPELVRAICKELLLKNHRRADMIFYRPD